MLKVCEGAYEGDARFTVSVDGTPVGGTETATLLGATEDFTFLGNWGSGQHSVVVDFTNGLSDAGGSRNLFIEGMSYDGTAVSGSTANLWGGGTASFTVGTAVAQAASSDTIQVTAANVAAGSTSSLSFVSSGNSDGTVSTASTGSAVTGTDILAAAAASTDTSTQVTAASFPVPETTTSAAAYSVLPSDTMGIGSLAGTTTSTSDTLLNATTTTQNQLVS